MEAIYLLASWLYDGQYVERDETEATKWWATAGKKNHAPSIARLGECYQYGRGVKADSTMAVKLYEQALRKGDTLVIARHQQLAEGGSLFSAKLLRECYANGIGVKHDEKKAIRYLQMCADQGDTESSYALALYELNAGRADLAADRFATLANAGHVPSQYYYGKLRMEGRGVQQDKDDGMRWMRMAADSQFVAAQYQLAQYSLKGDGMERDEVGAVQLLQQVATCPDSRMAATRRKAQWQLADCYRTGCGLPVSYQQAVQWYAESLPGNENAYDVMMADAANAPFASYVQGLKAYLIDRDAKKAADCFKNAEKGCTADAQVMEAVVMADTISSKPNAKKAAKMLTQLSDSHPQAAWYLSEMTAAGQGVAKDEARAVALLTQAAEAGVAEAQCRLGDRYYLGQGINADYVKAVEQYLKAEAQFHLTSESAQHLADCYEKKIATLPDLNRADERIRQLSQHKPNTNINTLLLR